MELTGRIFYRIVRWVWEISMLYSIDVDVYGLGCLGYHTNVKAEKWVRWMGITWLNIQIHTAVPLSTGKCCLSFRPTGDRGVMESPWRNSTTRSWGAAHADSSSLNPNHRTGLDHVHYSLLDNNYTAYYPFTVLPRLSSYAYLGTPHLETSHVHARGLYKKRNSCRVLMCLSATMNLVHLNK